MVLPHASANPHSMKIFCTFFLFALAVPNSSAGYIGNKLAQSACDYGLTALGLKTSTTCTCTGAISAAQGVTASLYCTLVTPICLIPPYFGGSVSLDWKIQDKPLKGAAGRIPGSITECITITSGLPITLDKFGVPNKLCVKATPSAFAVKLESCSATLGNTQCSSCTVCSSGFAITFDCSNVDLTGSLPGNFSLPAVKKCLNLIGK